VRVFEPPEALPVAAAFGGDEGAHMQACAATVNRAMEFLVRQCPQQYLWGYHRYKRPRRA
jgi:KDO2-lipid IV(A) lauroyltransferase